jgi:hypothetical protein
MLCNKTTTVILTFIMQIIPTPKNWIEVVSDGSSNQTSSVTHIRITKDVSGVYTMKLFIKR